MFCLFTSSHKNCFSFLLRRERDIEKMIKKRIKKRIKGPTLSDVRRATGFNSLCWLDTEPRWIVGNNHLAMTRLKKQNSCRRQGRNSAVGLTFFICSNSKCNCQMFESFQRKSNRWVTKSSWTERRFPTTWLHGDSRCTQINALSVAENFKINGGFDGPELDDKNP